MKEAANFFVKGDAVEASKAAKLALYALQDGVMTVQQVLEASLDVVQKVPLM